MIPICFVTLYHIEYNRRRETLNNSSVHRAIESVNFKLGEMYFGRIINIYNPFGCKKSKAEKIFSKYYTELCEDFRFNQTNGIKQTFESQM